MYVFEDLMKVLKDSNRPYDFDKITEAYRYAEKAHDGQMRQSGEPYITHPIAVAQILVELGMDTETICAGLLHDVVEDTLSTIEEIKKIFGADVALMVDGVTKLTKLSYSSKEQRQAENVRKMLLAMAKDVRVIIVKLSDRLHNMRTGEYWKEYKRREKALETMEVYAPLADRLGIRPIKEELEDISLRFLDPIAYEEIERLLKLKKDERENFLETIQQKIKERLDKEHMKFFLQSRVKSIYGIYRKVYMQGRNFDEIYDVYAVRVIVDTSIECYSVLGIMHDEFTPIPKRFKDYISTPKANMYQSLHTTVLDKEGGIRLKFRSAPGICTIPQNMVSLHTGSIRQVLKRRINWKKDWHGFVSFWKSSRIRAMHRILFAQSSRISRRKNALSLHQKAMSSIFRPVRP